MADYKRMLKNLVFFKEPRKVEQFILKENEHDQEQNEKKDESKETQGKNGLHKKKKNESYLLNKKTEPCSKGKQTDEKEESEEEKDGEKSEISKNLAENLQIIKKIYNIPKNGDMVLREFDIVVGQQIISAFMVFIDGMTDRKVINDNILQPLMLLSNLDVKGKETDVTQFVRDHILPHGQLKITKKFKDIIGEVNFGGCGIFIDGLDSAFTADVKGWEHRGIDRPNTELVIRGPQEAFSEGLRANTALIRKRLRDQNLIVENASVGKRSKTPCSLLYISDIANDSLVDEVRRRLKGINIDYIMDTGELEQYMEDSPFLMAPQLVATERPDRVASMLTEGKVAIVMHGSPFVLVMPATLPALIQSPEDSYIRFPYGNFLRVIRLMGILLALILPAIYIAITNYHHEMIPTDLLLSIESSREKVPFPSIVEILIMEIAFELIREAGIRIPGPIGPTLGIIGALILGQAAVAANIVSPILIIVVAVTGIGSFAIPNFSLALSFRLLRFGYIFLAAMAGFLGIATGLFIHGLYFVNAKSFGVPFMAPLAPKMTGILADNFTRAPIWKQEARPDYLNTKNENKQPKISRQWTQPDQEEDKKDEN